MRRRFLLTLALISAPFVALAGQPNILWITSEDNGPELGCYGDKVANTPSIDALASEGIRYTSCWSTAPVCAPARTAIITGMFPTSLGAQHMRSEAPLPKEVVMLPQLLRDAGYYTTNTSKEDYNFAKHASPWDDSSNKAHWKNRPSAETPFFSVVNFTTTHESQIRKRPHNAITDPADIVVPAYHPDAPKVRQDWAQYYDKITQMDKKVGKLLKELEDAGLAEDTIVFYYGDHGSGMPRGKRWLYQSGLHVPLIVRIPEKFRDLAPASYKAGGTDSRLLGFVDLAPSALALAGLPVPDVMQGAPFLGKNIPEKSEVIFGFRDRMDEQIDCSRAARNKTHLYIRNYMPHRPQGLRLNYMFRTPATQVWYAMHKAGKLTPAQSAFWKPKPPEELYDLAADPDQVNNLASQESLAGTLELFRTALDAHIFRVRDTGFLPETEIHGRAKAAGKSPFAMAQDPELYPILKIHTTANMAASLNPDYAGVLALSLKDADSAVRFWGVTGLYMRGAATVEKYREDLHKLLADPAPIVRIAAAEALGCYGSPEDLSPSLDVLLAEADVSKTDFYRSLPALTAIANLGAKAAPQLDAIRALPRTEKSVPKRISSMVGRMLDHIDTSAAAN